MGKSIGLGFFIELGLSLCEQITLDNGMQQEKLILVSESLLKDEKVKIQKYNFFRGNTQINHSLRLIVLSSDSTKL